MIPTVDHLVGQDGVRDRAKVALEAAWNDGTRLPHMLLVGPPGLGKTTMAETLAREVGVEIHQALGQMLDARWTINSLALKAKDKEIIFIDEIHQASKEAQTALYRAIDDNRIFVRSQSGQPVCLPVRDFVLLAATTDEYSLLPPLRQRFKVILPFQFYSVESLAMITDQRARTMGISLAPEVALGIAERSRGTPRLAIRLLEACHRYARSRGETEVTTSHFEATVDLEQLDELGLGVDEQRYLRFLAERHGEPVRLFTLEAALGIHRRTLQDVIEPFLLRCGVLERSEAGRFITQKGLSHLGLIQEQHVHVA